MAPAPASPPRSGRGLGQRLTAKVGPLPVWAWAAVILGAFLLYTRVSGRSSATPVAAAKNTSGNDSGAQPPVSGQGNPADNLNSDLLAQLLGQNQSNYDALLAALQSMTASGAGGGVAPAGDGSNPGGPNRPVVQNNAPPSSVSQAGPAAGASPAELTAAGYSPAAVDATVSAVSSGYLTPDSSPLGLTEQQVYGYTGTETPLPSGAAPPPAPATAPSAIQLHYLAGRDPQA